MSRPKLLLSWSSGKDAAWALHQLRLQGRYEIAGLLTALNGTFQRVAMHAVREELLDLQAEAAGLPLWKLPLPWPCSDEQYAALMRDLMDRARAEGIQAIAYGDLFLEDVRAYRVSRHEGTGIRAVFPLWGRDTAELAREMLRGGLRARVTCVDPRHLGCEFAGRAYDEAFLASLPPGVDPCGERGEFHTFAWDGPMFTAPLRTLTGPVVARDGFHFADLLPRPATMEVEA